MNFMPYKEKIIQKVYFDINELADKLNTHPQYLHFIIRNHDVPHKRSKDNGKYLFKKEHVDKWVEKWHGSLIDILTDK